MKIPDRPRGYIFAFIATIAMANVYVFSKAALNELTIYQFGFFWFGMAIIWNLIFWIQSGRFRLIKHLSRYDYTVLIIHGLLEVAGTTLFFLAIETASLPAIMSFLQNLVPLFVIIMGVSMLGEKFTGMQVAGVVITMAGAVVTSFTGNVAESGFFVAGTGYMIASTLFLAATTIISKRYIKRIDPGIFTLNRSLFLFTLAIMLMLTRGESFNIPGSAWFNTMVGSLLGPFLTSLSTYTALKYIDASKSTIVQSSKGLFVTIGAWIYFNSIPEAFQVIGGLLTITGIVVLITAREHGVKKRGTVITEQPL
jgi:drug/metabolite transporter (DMT)-like permease